MAGPVAVPGEFETLGHLIIAAAASIGPHEAYVEVATGRRETFASLAARSTGLAGELRRRGVGHGDVLAVALPPSIDYAVACAAGALLGAVVTGINHRLGPREVGSILDRCPPRVLFSEDGFVSHALFPDVLTPSTLAGVEAADPAQWVVPEQCRRSDPAVIIWTSGTTGLPKGAWFDHANLSAAVGTAGEMTVAHDRRLSGIPMAHAGYMAKQWEQWAMALTLVLTPTPWSADAMAEVLESERITAAGAVPTQWAKLLDQPGLANRDLSRLRICLAATAPAAPELIERITATLGAPVVVRYAMTESPSITGTSVHDTPEVQYRTVGRPQEGVRVRLVDNHGHEVPSGEVGRVHVAGPCVMRGYWNDATMTSDAFDADRWLISGDLARLDAEGNLVLAGRIGDMYIRGGYNVYPVEVEHRLAEHPQVAAVAIVGAPRPVIGEIGVAHVVAAEPGDPPTLAELRAWVRAELADYKAPDELVLRSSLPLTAMGKVNKAELAARTPEP